MMVTASPFTLRPNERLRTRLLAPNVVLKRGRQLQSVKRGVLTVKVRVVLPLADVALVLCFRNEPAAREAKLQLVMKCNTCVC